jgi:hypothetical protein
MHLYGAEGEYAIREREALYEGRGKREEGRVDA